MPKRLCYKNIEDDDIENSTEQTRGTDQEEKKDLQTQEIQASRDSARRLKSTAENPIQSNP